MINKGLEASGSDFHLVEADLFIALYAMEDKPDFVFAFLELSSWMGTSFRSVSGSLVIMESSPYKEEVCDSIQNRVMLYLKE